DVAIEAITHLAGVRRRENAAMTERARTEFAGAVHPADDAPGGELVCEALDQGALVEHLDRLTVLARRAREVIGIDARTPERMIGHVQVGIPEIDAVCVQRRAERASGVARRRRDEHALESRFSQETRVGDAVERNPAAETEIGQAAFAAEPL